MNLKRTGWISHFWLTFTEVMPLDDLQDHYKGDECWCNPRIEYVPDEVPDTMIVHNSADNRELQENQQTPYYR